MKKSLVIVLALGLSTLATQPGCFVLGSPGPSAVSQGHRYQAGEPTYDEFFGSLYDLQVELARAPESEKMVRQKLARKVKLEEGASASMLGKKVGKRAEELATAGTGLKLEVKGLDSGEEPSAAMSVKGKELEPDDKTLFDAVTESARDAAKLYVRMQKAKKQIEGFNGQLLALDQNVDTAFRIQGPRKKSEVRKNLEDAKKLIPIMSARADEVGEAAKTTAKKLAESAATDNGQFEQPAQPEEPKVEEPPPEEPKKGEKGKKTEKKEGEAKPKAEPKAEPKPKPEAKPKPTAPDFEP